MGAARDQAGDVRDVGDEDRTGLARDLGEAGELDRARNRGTAAEDQLWTLLARELAHLVQVDASGVSAHTVLDGVEPLAGDGDTPAVREMATHWQRHPHHRVARFTEGEVEREVRGRA